jgi:hypothetical protein
MSMTCEHVTSRAGASSQRLRGVRTRSTTIEPGLLHGMFRWRAYIVGGCVRHQITSLERICDHVTLRRPLYVKIGGLKAAEPNPAR